MTREWVHFWWSMAVIAVCLAATTYALHGQPWALGSVADWVAGTATLAAVVVALKTARTQGALALQVAEDDRRARMDELKRADVRALKAMLLAFYNGLVVVRRVFSRIEAEPERAQDIAQAALDTQQLDVVKNALSDFVIHQMPSTTAADILMAARSSLSDIQARLDKFAGPMLGEALRRNNVDGASLSALLSLEKADQVLEALADEIIRRGGHSEPMEDTGVQLLLGTAAARARRAG